MILTTQRPLPPLPQRSPRVGMMRHCAVMSSPEIRRALHAAMEAGAGEHWDYNPPRDATQEYVRNHMDWTVAAAHYRFPPTPTDDA